MLENGSTKFVLSGYVTDEEGTRPCSECINGYFFQLNDLESNVEEVDDRKVGQIQQALMTGIMNMIAFSNNTDLVSNVSLISHAWILQTRGTRSMDRKH